MKMLAVPVVILCLGTIPAHAAEAKWTPLFDGRTFDGWTAAEHPGSFSVEDGAIRARGPRAHLFYVGDGDASFSDFELRLEVNARPGANSGIYFHTRRQDAGWPERGYEAQIDNTHVSEGGPGSSRTGSLVGVRNILRSPAQDDTWFTYLIRVEANRIQLLIDGTLIVDYVEPEDPPRSAANSGRRLSSGTFALQSHDPDSDVRFRNIEVRELPPRAERFASPYDPELDARFTALHERGFPVADLHVHLKGGLTAEQALEASRVYGVSYGIAVNCGLNFPIDSDEELNAFLDSYRPPPQTYLALQAEGREWTGFVAPETRRRFDYVFTDAMTWTDDDGHRMRLWMPEEVRVGDPETFMEQLVSRIEGVLREPIDVYVNPTYLPKSLADRYDSLWTAERVDRVIRALAASGVALEISNSLRLPRPDFVRKAKAAGVKLTCGTNNAGPELGHLGYCLEMIEELGLTPEDMWLPEVIQE
jgi:3-keto-disaccharide hydrolase